MNEYIVFPSSRALLILGIICAILAPIVGIILGIFYFFRPQLRKEGIIVISSGVIWMIVILLIVAF